VLPDQPGEPFTPRRALGESFQDERLDQELGQTHELEQVTFLVPNGWQAHDATGICDPVDVARTWYGRAEAAGGGWTVTLDRDAAMDSGAWRELKAAGGCRFTHIGRLTRADGSAFTGQEAQEALDRVRLGLNLALGRRITCALPVGWRGEQPVWSRWRSAPVDTFRSASHLLDETVCRQQIEEVVSRVLAFTADPARREALRHAITGCCGVSYALRVAPYGVPSLRPPRLGAPNLPSSGHRCLPLRGSLSIAAGQPPGEGDKRRATRQSLTARKDRR
jgi:hypothetical protein